jgi:hypothetical protein
MSNASVSFNASGLPETILDAEPEAARAALAAARERSPATRRDAIAEVVARWPRFLDAWAHLGAAGRDDIEAYAYFRIGYHRGLDRLRQNGWRGSGYVRWTHEENRGFLRAVVGLGQAAAAIGETDEVARCDDFVHQLDPAIDIDAVVASLR